jgi:hypothetical protein
MTQENGKQETRNGKLETGQRKMRIAYGSALTGVAFPVSSFPVFHSLSFHAPQEIFSQTLKTSSLSS